MYKVNNMAPSGQSVQEAVIGSLTSNSLRRVQVVKVKRVRNPNVEESPGAQHRNRRRRKLGSGAVYQFKVAMNSVTQTKRRKKRQVAHCRRMRCPTQQQFTTRERKRLFSRYYTTRRRRGRPLTKKEILEIDEIIRASTERFMLYRERVFTKPQLDYYAAKFDERVREPHEPMSWNEELLDIYKSSTDEKERRHLRKDFAVIREMVLIEEGCLPDDETSDEDTEADNDCDDYDYYVEDDASQFDQFLDEHGNLIDGVDFEVCEGASHPNAESGDVYMCIDYPESNKDYSDDDEPLHF